MSGSEPTHPARKYQRWLALMLSGRLSLVVGMMVAWVKPLGIAVVVMVLGVVVMAVAIPPSSDEPGVTTTPTQESEAHPPPGDPATPEELQAIGVLFDDEPFAGGQDPPRQAKVATEETFVFLQFNTPDPENAQRLDYVGLGSMGRFCAESRPDAEGGSFSHFHRWVSPVYSLGHGTVPASDGHWLSWLSVDEESPGVGYGLFATEPAECADLADIPPVQPPLGPMDAQQAAEIENLFDDAPFIGGQESPYVAKWLNENVFLFLEPASGPWPHVGIGFRGTFCADSQPTADFTHFQRYDSPAWGTGAGGPPGAGGYWMARYGTGAGSDALGIDRGYEPTPPPECQ